MSGKKSCDLWDHLKKPNRFLNDVPKMDAKTSGFGLAYWLTNFGCHLGQNYFKQTCFHHSSSGLVKYLERDCICYF